MVVREFTRALIVSTVLIEPAYAAECARVGDPAAVIRACDNAIRKNELDANAYRNRALALLRRGSIKDQERAIEDFNRVITIRPNEIQPLIDHASAYITSLDPRPAFYSINRALGLMEKPTATAYALRGVLRTNLGMSRGFIDPDKFVHLHPDAYEPALYDFDRAIKLDATNPLFFYHRAVLNFHEEKYDLAIKDLAAAIKLQPKNGRFYYFRANVYTRLSMSREAFADIMQAGKFSVTKDLYRELAEAAERMSDPKKGETKKK